MLDINLIINYSSDIKNKLLSFGVKKVDYVEIIDVKTLKKPKNKKFNLFLEPSKHLNTFSAFKAAKSKGKL